MKSRRIWAEVDLAAIIGNARSVADLVRPSRIMAVVKADAYGHGMEPVACALAGSGIDCFAVAGIDEACRLRAALGLDASITALSPLPPGAEPDAVGAGIACLVSDADGMARLSDAAETAGCRAHIHLEVDTGMGRTGGSVGAFAGLLRLAAQSPWLRLDGICTHLAAADTDPDFTGLQLARFAEAAAMAPAGVARHCAATTGILGYPEARYDLVRPGMLLYGLRPAMEGSELPLVPALALRCSVALVQEMPAGWTVGYGRTARLARPSRVAVLSVGYGDGYPRTLSNRGAVLVRGRRCPIIGTVCMDLTMVDVTDLPEVCPGDTATLVGGDGEERITVEEIARTVGTTEHEITTRLMPRVPRDYLGA